MRFYFEKLEVWQLSKDLFNHTYDLLAKFPFEERYGLCDQLRRASVSIPSNIAEGIGRFSTKEKCHFLEIALGSLMEVYCQFLLAKDRGFVTEEDLQNIGDEVETIGKKLNSFRSKLQSQLNNPKAKPDE